MQEEKEVAKSFKDEMAKKKENKEVKKKDDSVMSNVTNMENLTDPAAYSKDKLVEMLQNALISRRFYVKGSAPKGNGKPYHKSSDTGGSLSGNNDSDKSSTSSEEDKSECDVASSG